MSFKYIVAIVCTDVVASLESTLQSIGVGGITLTKVKGFGEYKNFFSSDHLSDHTKVEIFADESKVEALIDALQALANSIGVAAVIPVDSFILLRIESHDSQDPSQLQP